MYQILVSMVFGLIAEILRLKRKNNRANVPTCKRGIAGAFSRLLMRRGMVKLIAAEFTEGDTIIPQDMSISHLCLPFGWLVIPSFLCLITDAIDGKFRRFGRGRPRWAGYRDFHVWRCADDVMFVELETPYRMKTGGGILGMMRRKTAR